MRKPGPLLAIFMIVLVDILGLTIILPLLPFYTEKYGGGPAVYGLLVTTYAFCQLFSGPLLGRFSDFTGRKPLLLVSQVGTCIGFIILMRAHSLWMIFLSRIIDGGTAGNLSLAQAYISDVTTPKNRAKAFGLIGISFGIGFLIGPAASGFVSQYGYQYPPLMAACLSFLSICGTAFLLPTHQRAPAPEAKPGEGKREMSLLQWKHYFKFFSNPPLRLRLAQFFLFAFAFANSVSGFALFLERRFTSGGHPFGPKEVGYLMAYSGLLGVIIQGGLLGKLVDAVGERRLVAFGFISMGFGYAGLGWAHSLAVLIPLMTFSSFGTGTLRPALTSLITQSAGRSEQGTVLGLNQTLMSVAQIIAPLIAGALINAEYLIYWAAIGGVVGAMGLWVGRRDLLPEPAVT